MQRRRDRARLHAERVRDRLVVEICVVPQEEREPLPLRQGRDERLERAVLALPVRRSRLVLDRGLGEQAPLPLGRPAPARLVDDDPPQPGLERPAAAEAPPVPQRADEAVVNRLLRELLVARIPTATRRNFP